jgi:hypothetical protein
VYPAAAKRAAKSSKSVAGLPSDGIISTGGPLPSMWYSMTASPWGTVRVSASTEPAPLKQTVVINIAPRTVAVRMVVILPGELFADGNFRYPSAPRRRRVSLATPE